MKISTFVKRAQRTESEWAQLQRDFVNLTPARLAELSDSVLVMDKKFRPNLSRVAAKDGIKYTTIPMKGDKMLVVRFTLAKKRLKV